MPTSTLESNPKEAQKDPPSPSLGLLKRSPPVPVEVTPKKKTKDQHEMTEYFGKVLNAKTVLRDFKEVTHAKNYMTKDPVNVSLCCIGYGVWYAIYLNGFDETKEAPYQQIKPVLTALGITDKSRQRDAREYAFALQSRILCAAPRRKSKDVDEPILKTQQKSGRMGEPECVFMCTMHDTTNDSKLAILNLVVNFLQARGVPAEISHHCDRTNPKKQSLDHFITDNSIIRLVKHQWGGRVDTRFYTAYPDSRHALFSEPYPKAAHIALGYPHIKKEVVSCPTTVLTDPIDLCDSTDEEIDDFADKHPI
ncbi:unnamed protein product [Cylindrotheca closterium]|uniref:Uncharacterized protein n=1 Tax=Cylindrotheca closterium TaxID=2856 RepID=A0AAD2CFA0_9STRA|nr:unnamed protein product [Cylindrotheca closterium]